jgi:hypothetical protein
MPSPELIDFDRRFEQIVGELRASAPLAPESVRARVRELASAPAPEPPLLRRFGGRRVALVLIPVCLLGLVAGALVAGRGGDAPRIAAARELGDRRASPSAGGAASADSEKRAQSQALTTVHGVAVVPPQNTFTLGRPAILAPDRGRLQHYDVSLSLRVRDQEALSKATNEAMRLTRALGGFVSGVEYSSAETSRGDATLNVRVPVGKIDQAIARFSKLGRIRAQHVSIQDLQAAVNAQNRAILDTRKSIATLQEKLLDGSLPAARRLELQHQLAAQQSRLKALLGSRGSTVREGRLATVSLAFTTAKRQASVHHPGRIGRAAHDAVTLLARVGAGAVYVAILLGPFVALGFVLFVIGRALRRRGESRLLARA